eukprot:NODE_7276_length_1594_cov_1.865712.p1 GENE.NODE_7276_length_1594_cov_1.865712~~NODE_7276_length_1594_cov_1.865712.p1  ORF type:complete len:508 (-),score=126.68 NODE_7276_length_1594_cov_1.865712:71-1399(-)
MLQGSISFQAEFDVRDADQAPEQGDSAAERVVSTSMMCDLSPVLRWQDNVRPKRLSSLRRLTAPAGMGELATGDDVQSRSISYAPPGEDADLHMKLPTPLKQQSTPVVQQTRSRKNRTVAECPLVSQFLSRITQLQKTAADARFSSLDDKLSMTSCDSPLSPKRVLSDAATDASPNSSDLLELRGQRQQKNIFRHVQFILKISKLHHIAVGEVQEVWKEFNTLDHEQSGRLMSADFHTAIRNHLSIPEDVGVPDACLNRAFRNADGQLKLHIDFETFLLWSINTYPEEMLHPIERENRQVSRKHNIDICVVERIRVIFQRYDVKDSGEIDEESFRQVLTDLMDIKDISCISNTRLQVFWREIDTDGSGSVTFEEFVLWYCTFYGPREPNALVGRSTTFRKPCNKQKKKKKKKKKKKNSLLLKKYKTPKKKKEKKNVVLSQYK